MVELINNYFGKYRSAFINQISTILAAILECGSCNTSQIARQMTVTNGKSFKTNDMYVYRFFNNDTFKIDDSLFRCYINLVFDILLKNGEIEEGGLVHINVDFTTSKDNFLILAASVLLGGKAIMLYFTTRSYPQRSGQVSRMKMESSFIRSLNHLLSKKYKYVIVADRGFGNGRFAKLCEDNGFDYVLRVDSDLTIICDGEKINLESVTVAQKFAARVSAWGLDVHIEVSPNNDNENFWFLLSNRNDLAMHAYYCNRFKIEEYFQDCKRLGYDLENSKIRKYSKFRRLLYCLSLAHFITLYVGFIIRESSGIYKKKSLVKDQLNTYMILAISGLDTKFLFSRATMVLEKSVNLSETDLV